MKIELMGNYPDEVKDYVREYNTGVEHKDINTVNIAINSLVQLLFSSNDIERQAAMHALDQIGKIQPGFLKSAVKTLLVRYKGSIEEKSAYAGAALKGIFIGKKAEKLISDKDVLSTLKAEKAEAKQKLQKQKAAEAELVEKIKKDKMDLNFLNPFPEIKSIGQYYNNSVINNQMETAHNTLNKLVENLFVWEQEDPSKFMPGCMLLSKMFSKAHRQTFTQSTMNEIQKKYYSNDEDEKRIAEKILMNVLDSASDLMQDSIANELHAKRKKRKKERLESKKEAREKADKIKKVRVPVSVGWHEKVQEIAEMYNEAITSDKKEKLFKKVSKKLMKYLDTKKEKINEHSTEFFSILCSRNPEFAEHLVKNLLKDRDDPDVSLILQNIISDLEKNDWASPEVINGIKTKKKARLQKEKEEMEKLREKHEKIKEISIGIDVNWKKQVKETVKELNEYLIDDDDKKAQKITKEEIKKFLYAKDETVRKQGQEVFVKIAKKYPEFIIPILEDELVPLYLSDHEERNIAVDTFGRMYDFDLTEYIFKDKFPEVYNTIESEWAERKQEIENLQLQRKIDAIKADVTQLRIKTDWDKKIQKVTRQYNTGIKDKEKQNIIEAIQDIVDMHMNERKEDRQRQATKVLGLIAKKNIELIQPTIQMFLQLIDKSEDKDEKTRAIQGLGEVTKQRPGWAYFGIEKLVEIITKETDNYFRMRSMLELGRIGKKNPTMLIEHLNPILNALRKDPDKNVRRLAAMALGNMAEALPIEADKVLPALRDALHDEYILVRKFADRALTEIRKNMK